jgi:hypothetical protein
MVDVSREGTRYVLSLLGSLWTGNGNWEMEDKIGKWKIKLGNGRYHGSGTGNEVGM